jgi:hypothetical protein
LCTTVDDPAVPLEARPLIDELVEQRLLATDASKETGETTIEPAHEALLRQWGLLQGWLEEDFAPLLTLEALQRSTRDWIANRKSTAWIAHRGTRLKEVKRLSRRKDLVGRLTSADQEYLRACDLRNNQIKRRIVGVLTLLLAMPLLAPMISLGDRLLYYIEVTDPSTMFQIPVPGECRGELLEATGKADMTPRLALRNANEEWITLAERKLGSEYKMPRRRWDHGWKPVRRSRPRRPLRRARKRLRFE